MAANHELEAATSNELDKLLDKEPWLAVHPHRRNVAVQGHIFSLLSRAGCLLHEHFWRAHSQMPIKMFRALDYPEEAENIKKTPPCQLDPWSAGFLKQFAGHLDSPEALESLAAIASLAKLDTCSVEIGHARIRRRVQASSLHTWTQRLSEASADYVIKEYDRRRLHVRQHHGLSCVDKHLVGKEKQTHHEAACVSESVGDVDSTKKTGSGGAWRAFLHQQHGQGTERFDMREMSEAMLQFQRVDNSENLYMLVHSILFVSVNALLVLISTKLWVLGSTWSLLHFPISWCTPHDQAYKNLSEEQLQHFRTLGTAMTQAGPRKRFKVSQLPVLPSFHPSHSGTAGGTVGPSFSENLPPVPAKGMLPSTLEDLPSQVALARKLARKSANEKRQADKERASQLLQGAIAAKSDFHAGVGAHLPSGLLSHMLLNPARASLGLVTFWPAAADLAMKVVSAIPAKNIRKYQAHRSSLQKAWETQHEQIGLAPVDFDFAGWRPKPCFLAGRCLEDAAGQKTKSCRAALLKCMTHSFPAHTLLRSTLLDGGRVILALHISSPTAELELAQCLWFHLGEVYWNPVRPTFAELLYVEGPDELDENTSLSQVLGWLVGAALWSLSLVSLEHFPIPPFLAISSQATGKFIGLFDIVAKLDLDCALKVSWFHLVDVERPLFALEPRQIYAKSLVQANPDGPLQIWPLPQRDRCKAKRRTSRSSRPVAAVDATLEDSDGAASWADSAHSEEEEIEDILLEEEEDEQADVEEALLQTALEDAMERPDEVPPESLTVADLEPASGKTGQREPETAAGSSAMPAEPPSRDAPPHRAPPIGLGFRVPAYLQVVTPHGCIKYYDTTKNFVAECIQEGHIKCRLTRTSLANDRRAAQGRPL
eukprot:990264-Amphidinium_carterae.1